MITIIPLVSFFIKKTWMTPILLCLIIGLALAIERIIYLNLATTNTKKLLSKIEDALQNGGIEAAKEVCRNTSGPVASIFFQGLDRMNEGLDVVEKSVVSYGSVQMGRMVLFLRGLPENQVYLAKNHWLLIPVWKIRRKISLHHFLPTVAIT